MDGIILIDKEKGLTSRDVVNNVIKKIGTKKIGHTGTLDPIATGLLVLCVNEGCKLVELLQGQDKSYIAKVKLGISTDTYDITGNILKENDNYYVDDEKIKQVLNSFLGKYMQEVPIYSAIKVNGKKLYEYARKKEKVILPIREVEIKEIKLLSLNKDCFSFSVTVSSGTYIRSLINDISKRMGICMTMEELRRTHIGNFSVYDSCNLSDIKIIPLDQALFIKKIEVDNDLYKKISNGVRIKNIYSCDKVLFMKNNIALSIYQDNGSGIMCLYRRFNLL